MKKSMKKIVLLVLLSSLYHQKSYSMETGEQLVLPQASDAATSALEAPANTIDTLAAKLDILDLAGVRENDALLRVMTEQNRTLETSLAEKFAKMEENHKLVMQIIGQIVEQNEANHKLVIQLMGQISGQNQDIQDNMPRKPKPVTSRYSQPKTNAQSASSSSQPKKIEKPKLQINTKITATKN